MVWLDGISSETMKFLRQAKLPSAPGVAERNGFSLIELLTVIAIIAIFAAILLPTLSKARERSNGIYCLNNNKQLTVAWLVYADDHLGELPYNLVMTTAAATHTPLNWVNNLMTQDINADNTNLLTITDASLGPYAASTKIYHCPSDSALTPVQIAAGWTQRIRSYSMNGMVGNAGVTSTNGFNRDNPFCKQFFKLEQISLPTEIFVFLDQQADSIGDGYFMNYGPSSPAGAAGTWCELPAAYHNRAGAFSFADGHATMHHWSRKASLQAVALGTAQPAAGSAANNADLAWVLEHMSVGN
jgi:prepilin-type N-terminal cleavage/methylation domain-containing protein